MRKLCVLLISCALLAGTAEAQVSSPASNASSAPEPDRRTATALAQPAPMPDFGSTLPQLQQVVDNTRVDLARLRIEKWKADSSYKKQAESDAESLQRNLTQALPTLVGEVRANPGSLAAVFKLYRNVNALYDVMASLTESAGAFGPKEEYQSLSSDTANLDTMRRTFADKLELMAAAKDREITRLQAQARSAATSGTATPAKKIIVDDTEPAKPAAKKKKPAAKPPSTPQQ
jgi:hypothetical protein